MLEDKRIRIVTGHYGSGKTNAAINYAILLKTKGIDTAIYDLDIVNPYFRTVDGKNLLDKYGVELVASKYAATNVDVPAMEAGNYGIVDNRKKHAVVDVGGDDRGALALGRYAKDIIAENNYDMLLVVNKYRFETKDIDGVLNIKDEIERACNIKFNGIVNNSNLGNETTAQTVLDSIAFIEEVSNKTGLKIKFTCIREDLYHSLQGNIKNLMPMQIIKYGSWQ